MENVPSISVIICAHTLDRWQDLTEAVASLQQQTLVPQEIIVVIDHNPDLFARAQKHIPGVIAVENKGTRGLSGARNTGIACAQGQILAFLDDDAIATPNWLASLTQRYTQDPHLLGTGGTVTPQWEKARPAWFPEEFDWVVGCSYRGLPQSDRPIRNPIGANMSLRREIFTHVGGFRSDIGRVGSRPIGCEETELCIRASQHWSEGTFLYHPAAQVFHRVPQKRASWRYFCSRCYSEGLSKALVTRYAGSKDSLASERTYTQQTLPAGIVRGIGATLFKGDLAGIARASAIVVGLSTTIAGYAVGMTLFRKKQILPLATNPGQATLLPSINQEEYISSI